MSSMYTHTRYCSIAIAAVTLVSVAKDTAEAQRPPIIDMHLHAQNLWTAPGALEPLTGLRAAESTDDLQAMTFAALDAYNVVLAVASGPRAEAYRAAAPGRILASPLLFNTRVPVDSLRMWFAAGRYQALAEFAPQYAGLTPNAPELEPYFALA